MPLGTLRQARNSPMILIPKQDSKTLWQTSFLAAPGCILGTPILDVSGGSVLRGCIAYPAANGTFQIWLFPMGGTLSFLHDTMLVLLSDTLPQGRVATVDFPIKFPFCAFAMNLTAPSQVRIYMCAMPVAGYYAEMQRNAI